MRLEACRSPDASPAIMKSFIFLLFSVESLVFRELCHEDDACEEIGDGGEEYALGRAPEFEGVEDEQQCQIREDADLQNFAEDTAYQVQIERLERVSQVETFDIDISYKGREYQP